jgi:cobalt transporter subunit CbtB
MTDVTTPAPTTQAPTIPIDDIAPYAIFVALIAVLLFYFVGANEGATIHEWLHDGRHLLGFPCH